MCFVNNVAFINFRSFAVSFLIFLCKSGLLINIDFHESDPNIPPGRYKTSKRNIDLSSKA